MTIQNIYLKECTVADRGVISSLEADFISNRISGPFKALQILWINKGKMDDT